MSFRTCPTVGQEAWDAFRQFTLDGKNIIVGGSLLRLYSYDPLTGRKTGVAKQGQGGAPLKIAPDGKALAVADENKLHLIDLVTGESRLHARRLPRPRANLSPDVKLVAAGMVDGKNSIEAIKIWDVTSGNEVCNLSFKDYSLSVNLTFSPGGQFLYTTSQGAVQVLDVERLLDPSVVKTFAAATVRSSRSRSGRRSSSARGACVEANSPITDDQLAQLKDFPEVTALQILNGEKLTEPSLLVVKGLTNLEELQLSIQAPDAALANIKDLVKLRVLFLGSQPGDAGLAHLAGLDEPALAAASVRQGNRRRSRALKGMTNLEELSLYGCKGAGAGLVHLKGLTKLNRLNLNSVPLGEDDLAHLADLTELRVLDLGTTGIGDAGLAHLKKLANLSELDLVGNPIQGPGLKALEEASQPDRAAARGQRDAHRRGAGSSQGPRQAQGAQPQFREAERRGAVRRSRASPIWRFSTSTTSRD